jgi:hypothetical protein
MGRYNTFLGKRIAKGVGIALITLAAVAVVVLVAVAVSSIGSHQP